MNKSLLIGLFSIIVLTSFISAEIVCEVYDDFSSGVLDTSKWSFGCVESFGLACIRGL